MYNSIVRQVLLDSKHQNTATAKNPYHCYSLTHWESSKEEGKIGGGWREARYQLTLQSAAIFQNHSVLIDALLMGLSKPVQVWILVQCVLMGKIYMKYGYLMNLNTFKPTCSQKVMPMLGLVSP